MQTDLRRQHHAWQRRTDGAGWVEDRVFLERRTGGAGVMRGRYGHVERSCLGDGVCSTD